MESLDLRGIPCPKNTSLALIRISTLDLGEVIEILLDDGEPIENVPSSLTLEGHKVLSQTQDSKKHWLLKVEVGS